MSVYFTIHILSCQFHILQRYTQSNKEGICLKLVMQKNPVHIWTYFVMFVHTHTHMHPPTHTNTHTHSHIWFFLKPKITIFIHNYKREYFLKQRTRNALTQFWTRSMPDSKLLSVSTTAVSSVYTILANQFSCVILSSFTLNLHSKYKTVTVLIQLCSCSVSVKVFMCCSWYSGDYMQ